MTVLLVNNQIILQLEVLNAQNGSTVHGQSDSQFDRWLMNQTNNNDLFFSLHFFKVGNHKEGNWSYLCFQGIVIS